MQQVYNYFQLLYNLLILQPPENDLSYNTLNNLWKKKIQPIKEIYLTKIAIYNTIIKIKNILLDIESNIKNKKNGDILSTIVSEKDKTKKSNSKVDIFHIIKTFHIVVTLNYKNQLKTPYFKYEDQLEEINIFHKNDKINFISIDLLVQKLCEDDSLNTEIVVNQETNQTFNFINSFIFQCFGFISYELLINKFLWAHKYYKINNLLKPKINNRILHLIFKITKYLWDHEYTGCSYFKSSDELKNNLKKFLNNNDMKDQIKFLLDYKKDILEKLDINNKEKKENKISNNIFSDHPDGGFEFIILIYDAKNIALIITYISIKNFNKLYDHLYELNPTIKKDEADKPNLSNISNFSNKISNFFIEEVFSYDYLNARVSIVEKIIHILIELRNLRNFNDLFAVYSALISISLRLPKTWEKIDPKLKDELNSFSHLCSIRECYKNIREAQNKCFLKKEFYIPLINITTKHINFYDEGCKYINENGLVCIEKIIVNQNEIEEFKNELRPLRRKNKIEKLIKNNKELSELKLIFSNINPKDINALDNISKKLEPEFTLYKELDNRKRKTKTDLYIDSKQFFKAN